jgi:polyisoprenoid-binding protein YceI
MRKRDEVPQRMFPASIAASVGVASGAVVLGLAAWLGFGGPIPNLWSHRSAAAPSVSPVPSPTISTEPVAPPPSAAPSATETAQGVEVALSCDWAVQPGGRLGFTAHYGSDPVNGTFRKWQARIKFCPDDLPHAAINATINLASADTGDSSRDENLRGASFFDTDRFAQARFTASGFKLLGPGRYAANGTLSLHGVSRPARLVFILKLDGDNATAQGSTSLSRLAFGVGSDEWSATDQIPDAVAVQFTIRAHRAN